MFYYSVASGGSAYPGDLLWIVLNMHVNFGTPPLIK
jgi:hypothetical protein